MQIELHKDDLVHLVLGVSPYYDVMEHPSVKGKGRFSDNTGWDWHIANLKQLSEYELFELYKLCRDSWLNQ